MAEQKPASTPGKAPAGSAGAAAADTPDAAGSTEKNAKPTKAPAAASPPSTASVGSKATPLKPASRSDSKLSASSNDALKELDNAIRAGKVTESDVSSCRAVVKEYATLKDKVDKLKSLLGRSAKAQRESKVELEATQKRLHQALREIEKLGQRLERIQNRPTHMDLLMDFQTNFDKALLSVSQTGGEDTAPQEDGMKSPTDASSQRKESSALDLMLMQELGESRERIDKLESLNSTLTNRCVQLEASAKASHVERDEARRDVSRLRMEVKLAQMEAEQATRTLHDKMASLEEMQMEIDLVTKANAKANIRAAKGAEAANSSKTDRQKVVQLEAQVQALKEWALASAESKRLMQEKVTMLENKLRKGQQRTEGNEKENLMFRKNGSLVIGAGDKSLCVVELGEHAQSTDVRFVILRWKFDFTPADQTIDFNILKGRCTTPAEQKKADYLIKDRVVQGGAGGETEGAFNYDNCCTLLWSNHKSWIRPRTVKYNLDIVALK